MPYKENTSECRKALRKTRKNQGLCILCSAPYQTSFSICPNCRKKDNLKTRTQIRKGICTRCGKRKIAKERKQCHHCLKFEADRCRGDKRRHAQYRAWRQRLKHETLCHYSNSQHPLCGCCGESNTLCLTIDHDNSDGAKHRKQVGSTYIYPWLKKHKFPKGFSVLCFTCNHARFLNGGICPAVKEHAKLKQLRMELRNEKYHIIEPEVAHA